MKTIGDLIVKAFSVGVTIFVTLAFLGACLILLAYFSLWIFSMSIIQ